MLDYLRIYNSVFIIYTEEMLLIYTANGSDGIYSELKARRNLAGGANPRNRGK